MANNRTSDGHDLIKAVGKKLRFLQDGFVAEGLSDAISKRLRRLRAAELDSSLEAYDRADRLGRISRIRKAM